MLHISFAVPLDFFVFPIELKNLHSYVFIITFPKTNIFGFSIFVNFPVFSPFLKLLDFDIVR